MNIKPYLDSLIQTQDGITHLNETGGNGDAMRELQQQRREQISELVALFNALQLDVSEMREKLNVVGLAAQAFDAGEISELELSKLVNEAVFAETQK